MISGFPSKEKKLIRSQKIHDGYNKLGWNRLNDLRNLNVVKIGHYKQM